MRTPGLPMIATERLDLVPATIESTRAAIEGPKFLARCLHATVPATWPPDYLDEPALEFMLAKLISDPGQSEWWLHFLLLRNLGGVPTLVGTAGYKGPVDKDGMVEIGYGIVAEHQRRGYASEAVVGLVKRAFSL